MRLIDGVADAAPSDATKDGEDGEFTVELDVFSGPLSVLLSLIARKHLDVTEIALAEVTDEFIAFARSRPELDLSQVSKFLVVAAALLEMKAARLLPHDGQEEGDLELLEQRDLLFAKLLQYRALKEVARDIASTLVGQALCVPRSVPLEECYARTVPTVIVSIGLVDFAALAAAALVREHREPKVPVEHLHAAPVSVASQVGYVVGRLAAGERLAFADLCADAADMPTVVSRFLTALELLRAGRIDVEQSEVLGAFVLVAVGPPEPEAGVRQPGETDDSGHSQEFRNFGDSGDSGDARDPDDSGEAHG